MNESDGHSPDRPERRMRRLRTPVAAGAAAVGLCCCLPLLASVGASGVIAGLGLQSWPAVAAALAIAAIGVLRWRRRIGRTTAAQSTGLAGSSPGTASTSAPARSGGR